MNHQSPTHRLTVGRATAGRPGCSVRTGLSPSNPRILASALLGSKRRGPSELEELLTIRGGLMEAAGECREALDVRCFGAVRAGG